MLDNEDLIISVCSKVVSNIHSEQDAQNCQDRTVTCCYVSSVYHEAQILVTWALHITKPRHIVLQSSFSVLAYFKAKIQIQPRHFLCYTVAFLLPFLLHTGTFFLNLCSIVRKKRFNFYVIFESVFILLWKLQDVIMFLLFF